MCDGAAVGDDAAGIIVNVGTHFPVDDTVGIVVEGAAGVVVEDGIELNGEFAAGVIGNGTRVVEGCSGVLRRDENETKVVDSAGGEIVEGSSCSVADAIIRTAGIVGDSASVVDDAAVIDSDFTRIEDGSAEIVVEGTGEREDFQDTVGIVVDDAAEIVVEDTGLADNAGILNWPDDGIAGDSASVVYDGARKVEKCTAVVEG